jgi:multidrug efflux pump subunit AcrA (membrane-fusion protein)
VLSLTLAPAYAPAQVAAAAERSAARAAARAAERSAARAAALAAERKAAEKAAQEAAARSAARQAGDRVVRRWNNALCKPSLPCPLPESVGRTFTGGSYDEVVLARDTVLYRVHADPSHRLGEPGQPFSYWTRSDARYTQAVIDSAIPVSRNANTAHLQVAIMVPKGTRLFEGRTASIPHGGPTGGGNQIVLERVPAEWVLPR